MVQLSPTYLDAGNFEYILSNIEIANKVFDISTLFAISMLIENISFFFVSTEGDRMVFICQFTQRWWKRP